MISENIKKRSSISSSKFLEIPSNIKEKPIDTKVIRHFPLRKTKVRNYKKTNSSKQKLKEIMFSHHLAHPSFYNHPKPIHLISKQTESGKNINERRTL